MVIYSENILPDVNPRLLSRFHAMFNATRGSNVCKIYSSIFSSFFSYSTKSWNHGNIQKLIKKNRSVENSPYEKTIRIFAVCHQKFHDRILSLFLFLRTSNSEIGSLRNVGIKSRYQSELLRLIYAEPPLFNGEKSSWSPPFRWLGRVLNLNIGPLRPPRGPPFSRHTVIRA